MPTGRCSPTCSSRRIGRRRTTSRHSLAGGRDSPPDAARRLWVVGSLRAALRARYLGGSNDPFARGSCAKDQQDAFFSNYCGSGKLSRGFTPRHRTADRHREHTSAYEEVNLFRRRDKRRALQTWRADIAATRSVLGLPRLTTARIRRSAHPERPRSVSLKMRLRVDASSAARAAAVADRTSDVHARLGGRTTPAAALLRFTPEIAAPRAAADASRANQLRGFAPEERVPILASRREDESSSSGRHANMFRSRHAGLALGNYDLLARRAKTSVKWKWVRTRTYPIAAIL